MRKVFMGVRIRRLREQRNMTQVALARALELSPSYLNQLEKNQRPLTVPVLLRLNALFGVDVQLFSEDEEARLITDLRDLIADAGLGEEVTLTELKELAINMPTVGRAMLTLAQRQRQANERLEAMAAKMGSNIQSSSPMPYEEVRDFFYAHHNHIADLDTLAEQIYENDIGHGNDLAIKLTERLSGKHGIRVVIDEKLGSTMRHFDQATGLLHLSTAMESGQQAFQMATQLAFLEAGDLLETLSNHPKLSGNDSKKLARIGLANYFAGALLLPYSRFLETAEQLRYDIDLLSQRFGVGFETICHRLSTLQRSDNKGVPFFLIRVDRAGNISKRQSATDFHFSRVGGSCPLWNVYEAFAQPGNILTQVAQMPDGRTYLWVARTVAHRHGGYGTPGKMFSIGLGCDVRHAQRLVYSQGLDLSTPAAATPIGAGCKVCEREACPQRAFPPIGKTLAAEENARSFAPYTAR